jgi:hypothetical protein
MDPEVPAEQGVGMNKKQQELHAAGKRAAYKNQCDSVIVAPDHTGEDNYHVCGNAPAHMGSHSSGSGYEWDWNGVITERPGAKG